MDANFNHYAQVYPKSAQVPGNRTAMFTENLDISSTFRHLCSATYCKYRIPMIAWPPRLSFFIFIFIFVIYVVCLVGWFCSSIRNEIPSEKTGAYGRALMLMTGMALSLSPITLCWCPLPVLQSLILFV